MARLVADDAQFVTGIACPAHEIDGAGIGCRVGQACPVDIALHFGPGVFLASAAQEIAHLKFVVRQVRRNVSALARDQMEDVIVIDDRVVEIETNTHGSWWRLSGCRGESLFDAADDRLRRQSEHTPRVILRSDLMQEAVGEEKPRNSARWRSCAASHSAIAPASPPMRLCSSTAATIRYCRNTSARRAASSGLTV